jgi:hypothetical protein
LIAKTFFKKELTLFLALIELRVAAADYELMDQLSARKSLRAAVAMFHGCSCENVHLNFRVSLNAFHEWI